MKVLKPETASRPAGKAGSKRSTTGRKDGGDSAGGSGGGAAAKVKGGVKNPKKAKLSLNEGDLTKSPMPVVLKPAVKKKLSEMEMRVAEMTGNGWCGWASGSVDYDYDVMELVREVAAYYTSNSKDVLAWMNDFVAVSTKTNKDNRREITKRASELKAPQVTWPSVVGRESNLWLNTTTDLKVLAMMKGRPVHLIQQYGNGTALVTVFTSMCAPPRIQTYMLGNVQKFKNLGGADAIMIIHNGSPGKQDGNHFNAIVQA